MRKIYYIVLLLFFLSINFTLGQTFISKTAFPMDSIVNSNYIKLANRVSYDTAYLRLNNYGIDYLEKSSMAGEYFLINGALLKSVVITDTNAFFFKPLIKVQEWDIEMASGGDSRPLASYYHTEIKSYNSFKVLISYFTHDDNSIQIIIQDNLGRYVVKGTLFHEVSEKANAIALIESIFQGMSFKP